MERVREPPERKRSDDGKTGNQKLVYDRCAVCTYEGCIFAKQYYFHFRIEQNGKFRVFGYQKEQFFCITHIDRKGEIHH